MAAGKLGLMMTMPPGHLPPVWPATGVAIWMLVAFGQRMWLAVAAGTLLVQMVFAGVTWSNATVIAAGSTLEALAGAWLWRTVRGKWPGTSEVGDAVGCLVAAVVAPVAGATVGAVQSLGVGTMPMPQLWFAWWHSNAIGALLVLPVLLAAPQLGRMVREASPEKAGQAAVVLAAAAGVSWLSFGVAGGGSFLFSILPVLLLAVVWFGAPGSRLLALLIAVAATAVELSGRGPFGGEIQSDNLLNLELLLAAIGVVALILPVFRARDHMLLPVAVLLIGWMLSGWLFTTLQRERLRRQEDVFNGRVAAAEAAIQVRMTSYVDALLGGASYFAAAKSVGRGDWRAYAESLQLAKRYPSINGIGVIFPLTASEMPAWLERMRADGAPGLNIVPFPATTGPAEDVKYVITFIEPPERNLPSVGRNVATEPSRRLAAELARDTGEPRMNRRIPGSRDTQHRSGFLLYMPLYRKNMPVETVEERRAAHFGWVYVQFFADNFLNGVLGPMHETLRLHFFEDGTISREHLLYASGAAASGAEASSGVAIAVTEALPRFERVTTVEMAGQRFHLGWRRGPKYPADETSPMAWAAVSFSFATLLLAGLVMSLQTFRRRAEQLVTERTADLERTQQALATTNRLQRGVLDGTIYSVISTITDGRIVTFNAGAEKMLGYTRGEMVGVVTPTVIHDPAELTARAAEAGAPPGEGTRAGFAVLVARARRGDVDEREWTYIRKDGRRLPVLLSVTALRDESGGSAGFLMIAQDLTARRKAELALRESEERARLFAEHAPAAVAMFDREMRYVVHSQRWLTDYGLTGRDIIGRSYYEVLPETSENWKAIHRRCLAGATEINDADPFDQAGGKQMWLSWRVQPWHNAAGEIGGIVIFSVDITARVKLEQDLARARDHALEASRLKSEFLTTISHEIRTPMNAVIGMAELLAGTPLDQEQEEMVSTIMSGAENLLTIINDILDFSRIEAGRMRLDAVEFCFRLVVDETVALLAPRAHQKRVALSCDVALPPAAMFVGDSGRVRQILTNLIGNAIKFTDEGKVDVTVSTVSETANRTRLRVSVRDTGVGIPQEAKSRLFLPFTQVDGSLTRRFGGTGLGLAITRQLVDLMGGDIGFESELGKGSVFWFEVEFPRGSSGVTTPAAGHRHPLAQEMLETRTRAPAKPVAVGGGGPRLLVVEDNPANQMVAAMMLTRKGYRVEIAPDGQLALEKLVAQPFDGVLMDCQMPVLDGYEATRRIRAGMLPGVDARLPIIGVTAYARSEDRDRCLETGMNEFVTKPIRAAELFAALERCGLGPEN